MTPQQALEFLDAQLERAFAQGAFADQGKRGTVAIENALNVLRKALAEPPCAPCEEKKNEPTDAAPKA